MLARFTLAALVVITAILVATATASIAGDVEFLTANPDVFNGIKDAVGQVGRQFHGAVVIVQFNVTHALEVDTSFVGHGSNYVFGLNAMRPTNINTVIAHVVVGATEIVFGTLALATLITASTAISASVIAVTTSTPVIASMGIV